MKQLMSMLVLSLAALSLPATASTHREMPANAGTAASGPGMTKQQSKMGSCNAEAGDKKGDERKGIHEAVPLGQAGRLHPAGEDEDLQQDRCRQEGRRAEGLHEGVPERLNPVIPVASV
jgi:hypothetical protein